MTNNAIGVLDSGVGGLSVLSQMVEIMPNQSFVYFGDTKNMPYGTKTPEQIFNYTKNIIDFFISKGIKTIAFACNTTSAVAYDDLVKHYKESVKIYPLIQSVASKSVENLKDNDTIAVLATLATIKSKKYEEEIKKINNKINVIGIECSGFVEIVENRLYNDPFSIQLIKNKLEVLKENNVKRVILGCTHYPYLVNIFKNILDIEYFNPAKSLAELIKKDIKTTQDNQTIEFYVSNNPNEFKLSAKTFFDIKQTVNLINL